MPEYRIFNSVAKFGRFDHECVYSIIDKDLSAPLTIVTPTLPQAAQVPASLNLGLSTELRPFLDLESKHKLLRALTINES
jgi:hypothetical protein